MLDSLGDKNYMTEFHRCLRCGNATNTPICTACVILGEPNQLTISVDGGFSGGLPYRPNKIERVFIELEIAALWSTCQRRRVGSALITFEWQVLITARNGTPVGQKHCQELATPDERCVYCIHSETNIINRAARMGLATQNKRMATLSRPCLGCSNNILEAGIGEIIYRDDYDTDGQKEYVMSMFRNAGIQVSKFEETPVVTAFREAIKTWEETWKTIP